MLNSNQTPFNSNDKGNHFDNQLKVLEQYFKENTVSRYMAAIDTGIPIQNVCRYIAMLYDMDLIAVIRKDKCQISGEIVQFLSTNPELFPNDNQLKLWE